MFYSCLENIALNVSAVAMLDNRWLPSNKRELVLWIVIRP